MKVVKKVLLICALLSCVSGFAFGASRRSKKQKQAPFYAKVEAGFEGGNIVNGDYTDSYAYFGVIKPTFGWNAISSLPNLAFEGYLKFAFANFNAKIEYDYKDEDTGETYSPKAKYEASDFIFTPGVSAIWTFNPSDTWIFFAGGGIELPIESVDSNAPNKDRDTSVGFDITATGGIRGKIDNQNEALASLNFSVISHNSWGLSAGFLHRF